MAAPDTPPLIDNPAAYVGMLAGRDDVALVLSPGTPQEQRICFSPLAALAIATELASYGKKQLDRQAATLARHERNTTERRGRLDA